MKTTPRTIPCSVCGEDAHIETDRVRKPGHYTKIEHVCVPPEEEKLFGCDSCDRMVPRDSIRHLDSGHSGETSQCEECLELWSEYSRYN